MYENTGPAGPRMAAELIEAGVDVHEIYRRVYEGVPYGKLALLARGLWQGPALRRRAADRDRADARGLRRSRAPRRATPRASSTTCARSRARAVAALVRDRICDTDGDGKPRARCRCAPATSASTSRRSPAPRGAAVTGRRPGFTTAMELAGARRVPAGRGRAAALAERERRGHPVRQAGRDHLARRRRAHAPALRRGVKVGHAGTLDPFATGLLLVLLGRATRVQRFLMALPQDLRGDRAVRGGLEHRRPRGRDRP